MSWVWDLGQEGGREQTFTAERLSHSSPGSGFCHFHSAVLWRRKHSACAEWCHCDTECRNTLISYSGGGANWGWHRVHVLYLGTYWATKCELLIQDAAFLLMYSTYYVRICTHTWSSTEVSAFMYVHRQILYTRDISNTHSVLFAMSPWNASPTIVISKVPFKFLRKNNKVITYFQNDFYRKHGM